MGKAEDIKRRAKIAYGSFNPDKDRRDKLRKLDPDVAAKFDEMDRGISEIEAYTNRTRRATDATEIATKRLEELRKMSKSRMSKKNGK